MYIKLSKVSDGDAESTSQYKSILLLDVTQARVLAVLSSWTTLITQAACVETSSQVSDMAFKTTCRTAVTDVGSLLIGTTNNARFSMLEQRIKKSFSL